MDNVQKLFSDIEKLKKHERAERGTDYDGERVCRKINNIFATNNRFIGETAASFVDYWFNTYILASKDIKNEPSEENLGRLAALQCVLDGDDEDGDSAKLMDCLSHDDWKALCDIVNTEAEDLPLDVLNQLMALFMDKQAF